MAQLTREMCCGVCIPSNSTWELQLGLLVSEVVIGRLYWAGADMDAVCKYNAATIRQALEAILMLIDERFDTQPHRIVHVSSTSTTVSRSI